MAAAATPIVTPIAVTAVSPRKAPAITGPGGGFVPSEINRSCVLSPSSGRAVRPNAAANAAEPSTRGLWPLAAEQFAADQDRGLYLEGPLSRYRAWSRIAR